MLRGVETESHLRPLFHDLRMLPPSLEAIRGVQEEEREVDNQFRLSPAKGVREKLVR